MPSNPLTPADENLPRGILLVEEYSALGVAISSALHKFAPLHGIEVVRRFAEAETAAAAMRPELFVLDLDPPPTGEIEFLNKLKANYPQARVLVIAAGISPELRAARGTAGAIQFIEKPFDLAEFGAAVQALLGPWAVPPGAGLRGTLGDLHLVDIVELKCLAGSTAVVRIEAAGERRGEIHFQKGDISHAEAGAIAGLAALEELVRWPDARVSEAELPNELPRTIDTAWQLVLLQIVRKVELHGRRKPSATLLPSGTTAKTGKKILVVDDTEMLLIFVADVLATADQHFQILTAATGGEALRLAASERPDLLLLDYCLPDLTGDKVCRALLENPGTARIPVLMMSGHLVELARTAQDYENVVAALPKPFLSGALINEVEKLLAAGPLPKPARPKPIPNAPSPSSTDGESTRAGGSPPAAKAPLPKSTKLDPPPTEPKPIPATSASPAGAVVRPSTLSVTLALNVVALQFNSSFQMETALLQPLDRIVAASMAGQKELHGVAWESGFRLGEIGLGEHGQLETMRLLPTRQPAQLAFPSHSFPVGTSQFQRAQADSKLRLTAPEGGAMRVRLIAQFELLRVEFLAGLEVAAVLLKAQPAPVLIRSDGGEPGRAFEILEVQLDSANELQNLLVRPMPGTSSGPAH